jgi:hypothetical protein
MDDFLVDFEENQRKKKEKAKQKRDQKEAEIAKENKIL